MLNAIYVERQFLTIDLDEDIIPRVLKLYDSMRENCSDNEWAIPSRSELT